MNTVASSLPLAATPRRAQPWLARAGHVIWQALEAAGQARAQRHLLDFAHHCEAQQPELARELRSAARQGPQG